MRYICIGVLITFYTDALLIYTFQLFCLRKHTLPVSDVHFAPTTATMPAQTPPARTRLLSASYDQRCIEWDWERQQDLVTVQCDGFVQTCAYSPVGTL